MGSVNTSNSRSESGENRTPTQGKPEASTDSLRQMLGIGARTRTPHRGTGLYAILRVRILRAAELATRRAVAPQPATNR